MIVSGGLNNTTSAMSAPTTVNAAVWCRKAMRADAYIGASGISVRFIVAHESVFVVLVPADFPPQPLRPLRAGLRFQSPLLRSARGLGFLAGFGRHQGSAN